MKAAYVPALSLALTLACGGAADAPPGSDAPAPPLLAATDQFFTRDSVRLRYRETGRGTPVILVHGYSGRLEFMAELADSLMREFRVVALDVRGFGQSDTPDGAPFYGNPMADDVIGLLDHLGIRRAHLVGHSMGPLISADLAVRYPDRIASVSLIGGPFYSDSASMATAVQPYVRDQREGRGLVAFIKWVFPGLPDSVVQRFHVQMKQTNDSLVLIDAMAGMPALVVDSTMQPSVKSPALVAVGSLDPLLPFSRAIAGWWPGARLVEVAGADHANILARPEVIAGIRRLVAGQ
jgi:pimeloyl-ACP methyl ester carboxylesterase